MMTFLSNPIVLAHLGRRLTEVSSILFQPEELQKGRLASCIPRAPQAVRWYYEAWTCCWSALLLECTYSLHHLLALFLKDGRASIRTFGGRPVYRERESKQAREQNAVCLSSASHYGCFCFGKREKAMAGHAADALNHKASYLCLPVARQPPLNRKAQVLEGIHLPPGPKSTFRMSGCQALQKTHSVMGPLFSA